MGALEWLHEKRIVYRDVKLENVMLDQQGYVKLVDFGTAKKLDEGVTRTFTIIGTLLYMAPEVMQGRGYGYGADVWSLGVMLFALVCGRFPVGCDATNEHDLIMAVIEGSYAIPDGYTDNPGRRLIQGMLCKQPEKRLGAGLQGWGEIKGNKFFQGGMSGHLFDKLLGREIDPPVSPPKEMYSEEGRVETVTLSDAELLGNDEDDMEDMTMTHTRTRSPSPRNRSPGSMAVSRRLHVDSDGRLVPDGSAGDSSPRVRSRNRSHSPKQLTTRRHSNDSPTESGLTPVP